MLRSLWPPAFVPLNSTGIVAAVVIEALAECLTKGVEVGAEYVKGNPSLASLKKRVLAPTGQQTKIVLAPHALQQNMTFKTLISVRIK